MKYQTLLEALTNLELTTVYNALITRMPAGQTIQAFHTKQDAVKRLMWLIGETKLSIQDIVKLIPEDTVRHRINGLIKEQEPPKKAVALVKVDGAIAAPNANKKIHLLTKENPKRRQSASYDRFAKYKEGMTVAEALKVGITKADLAWDQKRNFIKLED